MANITLDEHRLEELTKACKNSKDARVRSLTLAVRMVLVNYKSITETAKDMVQETEWVTR